MSARENGGLASASRREQSHPRVAVFACGEPLRGDDSVAGLALASLPPSAGLAAEIRLVGALGPDDLLDLPAGVPVIVVDAVSGVAAGRVVAFDLAELPARASATEPRSTHQLSLDRVIGISGLLRDEPLRGRFVGIGVGDVTLGAGLSEPVRRALPDLQATVAEAIVALTAG